MFHVKQSMEQEQEQEPLNVEGVTTPSGSCLECGQTFMSDLVFGTFTTGLFTSSRRMLIMKSGSCGRKIFR